MKKVTQKKIFVASKVKKALVSAIKNDVHLKILTPEFL